MNDNEWMMAENERLKLKPPTKNSLDSFQQKVGQRESDIKNNQSVEIIRGFVYRSIYLYGECGDMPVLKL